MKEKGLAYKKKGKRLAAAAGEDDLLVATCTAHGLPEPILEYRFNVDCEDPALQVLGEQGKPRQWRFDMLFDGWLAVEKQGGVWARGHHSRGKDQIDDMRKLNAAQMQGYVVLQFVPEDFNTGFAFAEIKKALGGGAPL